MRILHTSDWHVGKVLKGRNRHEEHIRVLAQVVDTARAERPDLVIIAGDLYDTAAPTADATRVVTRALTALRNTGAQVVAIGGTTTTARRSTRCARGPRRPASRCAAR